MPNKRLEDLTAYQGVLPYASELFGVYQPLIGWKSKRILQWASAKSAGPGADLITKLLPLFESQDAISFNADCAISPDALHPAAFRGPRLLPQRELVLQHVRELLHARQIARGAAPQNIDEWREVINDDSLSGVHDGGALKAVWKFFQSSSIAFCRTSRAALPGDNPIAAINERLVEETTQLAFKAQIGREQAIAAILTTLVDFGALERLNEIFYEPHSADPHDAFKNVLKQAEGDFRDPFLSFDPKLGAQDASVSPLGIVHLFSTLR